MADLAEIERLEYLAIDYIAKATNSASKTRLQKCLAVIRAMKTDFLRSHPSVLRKVAPDPLPRDQGNAPSPDAALGSPVEPEHWRSPANLAGLTLYTTSGHMVQVPPSGIVEVHPDHHELKADLEGQGLQANESHWIAMAKVQTVAT